MFPQGVENNVSFEEGGYDDFCYYRDLLACLESYEIDIKGNYQLKRDTISLIETMIRSVCSSSVAAILGEVIGIFNSFTADTLIREQHTLENERITARNSLIDTCLSPEVKQLIDAKLYKLPKAYRNGYVMPDPELQTAKVVYCNGRHVTVYNGEVYMSSNSLLTPNLDLFSVKVRNLFITSNGGYGCFVKPGEPMVKGDHPVKEVNYQSDNLDNIYFIDTNGTLVEYNIITYRERELCTDKKFKHCLITYGTRYKVVLVDEEDMMYGLTPLKLDQLPYKAPSDDIRYYISDVSRRYDIYASNTKVYALGHEVMDIDCEYMYYENHIGILISNGKFSPLKINNNMCDDECFDIKKCDKKIDEEAAKFNEKNYM